MERSGYLQIVWDAHTSIIELAALERSEQIGSDRKVAETAGELRGWRTQVWHGLDSS